MMCTRLGSAGCLLNGNFYVSGGYNDENCEMSVERYDFVANEWCEVRGMNRKRRAHSLIPYNNKLFAIGGVDENRMKVNTVEEYDPQHDTWVEK